MFVGKRTSGRLVLLKLRRAFGSENLVNMQILVPQVQGKGSVFQTLLGDADDAGSWTVLRIARLQTNQFTERAESDQKSSFQWKGAVYCGALLVPAQPVFQPGGWVHGWKARHFQELMVERATAVPVFHAISLREQRLLIGTLGCRHSYSKMERKD